MKSWTIKISIVALITHIFLIFMGPYIVMNQLDRNIADAIENPFDGCEDTYDGIIGYLDQVCISKRSSTRMPNYDFMYTMCRYDLANGDLFVSMPVPEEAERTFGKGKAHDVEESPVEAEESERMFAMKNGKISFTGAK